MIVPCRRSSSPRACALSWAACAMLCVRNLRFCLDRGLVVYLDFSLIAKRADHLIAAGDDLVALFKAAQYLDVRRSCDAGFHFYKLGFIPADDEHALNLFFLGA